MFRLLLLLLLVVLPDSTHEWRQLIGRARDDTVYVTVQARPDGADKIVVEWTVDSSVSDSVTSYDLSWSTGGEGDGDGSVSIDDGSTNTYTITGLSPCTTYTITLQPYDDTGPLGQPDQTSATTATQAVTPVSSVVVTVVANNPHQLGVSWDLYMDIGNCPGYYKVTWEGSGGSSEADVRDTTSYTITGLDPWTLYTVCVDSGDDESSLFNRPQCGEARTSEDVPGGPPQDVKVSSRGIDTITLQWQPPAKPNGVIVSYTVTWSPEDGGGTYTTPGDTYTYTITGLVTCTTYTITVTATTSKGDGPPGQISDSTEPVVPSSPSNLVIATVTNKSDQLDVTWTQPEHDDRCAIISNTVTWLLNSTGDEVGNKTFDPAETYSITGLDAWTTYRVCVTADVLGGQSPEACGAQTTDEDKPGSPPQNLKVTSVTTDTMTLKWQPPIDPNGVIVNYEINWIPEDNTGRDVVTGETYDMTGLQACTSYTVTVTAATDKGSGPPADTGSSTQIAAPGPPTDVAVAVVTDQSDRLKVTWTQAEVEGRCNITRNTITWRLSNVETPLGNETVEPTETYTITGLDTWTSYLVCVSATSQGLDGPEGPCVNQTTDEDVPGSPPLDVRVSAATTDSITLTWDPPAQPNGDITNYLVVWSSDNDPSDAGNATTEGLTHTVSGLLACSNYTLTVSAGNSKGYGPNGETFGETQPGAPGPPTDVTVNMVYNQSEHLTVSWTQAKPAGKCGITSNTVTWQLKDDDNVLGNETMDPTESYTITGLDPWTTYRVCVSATYLHLTGPEGDCVDQTTDEDLPGPPVTVATQVLSSASILVVWDPPLNPNGAITEYHINWISELGASGEGVAESNATSYSARNLTECTAYSFTVTAATSKGLGEASETAENTTDTEAPPPPAGVSCTSVQSRQLTVAWERPDTACEVTQYVVSYDGQVLWDNSISEGGTVNTNETSITLGDLLPWTTYSVCVSAEAEGSLMGNDGCCEATTKEEVPDGPPLNVTVVARTSSTISLQWDPPAAPNGAITSYLVTWSPGDGQSTTNDTELTLTALLPCTTYSITVTAATSQGYGPPADTSASTKSEAPSSVTRLNLTQLIHEFSLEATWAPVTPPGNCELKYKVTWSPDNNEVGYNTTTEPHFTIADLAPGTKYNVCVTAMAEGETADPVCDDETTVTTRLDLHLEATSTTITASWYVPEPADSFIVAWSHGSDGDLTTVHGDSCTIEEAIPCTNYSVTVQAMDAGQPMDVDNDFIRTLPQATSSVTNLNVSQVSDNPTLDVTWSPVTPPGNCDLAYKVTWSYLNNTDVGNDTTIDPHYTITNLAYDTVYNVCVASSVEGELASPVCEQATLNEDRLALTLVPTSTTISVSWTLIKNADSYFILWGDGSTGAFDTVDATKDKYDITGLHPCTNYSVQVQAKAGNSQLKAESASTRTLPEATSVSDVTVAQMKREPALSVTWSAVTPPGNCGLNYKLHWSYPNNTEAGHDATSDLHYNITGLDYDTEYTVCVISSVEGEDASPVCGLGTTIDSRLGIYLEATSTTITVYWNLIEGVDSYRLTWFDGEDGAWTSVGGETDNFVINDLDPCSNYTIDLQALAGGQQVEHDKDSIMTSPMTPPEVTDLSLTQVGNETTLDVTWLPVTPPGNCDVTYKVTWSYPNDTEAGRDTTTEPHYTITDLGYDTEYTVCVASSIQGLNADQVCGKGSVVRPSVAGAVERLRVSSGATGWVRVEWVRPDGVRCDVQGYRLTWNTHTIPHLLPPDTTRYTITRLKPHTTYTISLQTQCGGTWGPARTVEVRTAGKRAREGTPGHPSHQGKANRRLPPLSLTHAGLRR